MDRHLESKLMRLVTIKMQHIFHRFRFSMPSFIKCSHNNYKEILRLITEIASNFSIEVRGLYTSKTDYNSSVVAPFNNLIVVSHT